MKHTKQFSISGDALKIEYTGSVWVAPCCGASFATADQAMQCEVASYLRSCGESVPDDDGMIDINRFGEWTE